MVPPASDRIPPVPPYSGSHHSTPNFKYAALMLSGRPFHAVLLVCRLASVVLQPRLCRNTHGLGSSAFARHYLRNHFCFLFLQVLRCFSSLRSPHFRGNRSSTYWVPPFGYLWISGYLHLPTAFRSLSRPSSPLRA